MIFSPFVAFLFSQYFLILSLCSFVLSLRQCQSVFSLPLNKRKLLNPFPKSISLSHISSSAMFTSVKRFFDFHEPSNIFDFGFYQSDFLSIFYIILLSLVSFEPSGRKCDPSFSDIIRKLLAVYI